MKLKIRSQRRVSEGSKRRSFTSVRVLHRACHRKRKLLHLMPPHQLYHSAHSCHLDHFLLPSSLSSVKRTASRLSSALRSRYHQGGDCFLKALQLMLKAYSGERWRGSNSQRYILAVRVQHLEQNQHGVLRATRKHTSFNLLLL